MGQHISFSRRIWSILNSQTFFGVILGLFIFQAAWIALTSRYPMAFDEDFHLGVIRLYAHHIGPFWANQPESADKFGAIARDPSYLYHYLMSFPYRLISLFTNDQTIQVLILRALNIGLFVSGLILFRRLFLRTGISRAVINVTLLVFVLLPVVPLLGAQINYDNLVLPLTVVSLLLVARFNTALTKEKQLDLQSLLLLVVVCLLTSLVKYAFLPIFLGIVGFIIVRIWQIRRTPKGNEQLNLRVAWWRLSRFSRLGLMAALILSSVLFVERYGINVVRYHTPIPDCSKVLSVEKCREYGPWIRDYNYKINKVSGPKGPLTFTREWFYGMWLRLFFALGGPNTNYESKGPLLVPGVGAIVIGGLSVVAFIVTAKRLWKRYNAALLTLFLVVTAIYIGILWLDEYQAFLHTGQPVAINGRYLLPVFPLVMLVAAAAVAELFKKRPTLKAAAALTIVICMAWGGGTLTYILRSDDTWYWDTDIAKRTNHAVKSTVGPITPSYNQPTQFLH